MKTTQIIDNQPHGATIEAEQIEALEHLLAIRLGQASGSAEDIKNLEAKAKHLLDPAGGITKEAYASASQELITLARKDRSQRIDGELAEGGLCEYSFRGLPSPTTWRELSAWLETQGLHPLRVIVPHGADYGFCVFSAEEGSKVDNLFKGESETRFKATKLNVRRTKPRL